MHVITNATSEIERSAQSINWPRFWVRTWPEPEFDWGCRNRLEKARKFKFDVCL